MRHSTLPIVRLTAFRALNLPAVSNTTCVTRDVASSCNTPSNRKFLCPFKNNTGPQTDCSICTAGHALPCRSGRRECCYDRQTKNSLQKQSHNFLLPELKINLQTLLPYPIKLQLSGSHSSDYHFCGPYRTSQPAFCYWQTF